MISIVEKYGMQKIIFGNQVIQLQEILLQILLQQVELFFTEAFTDNSSGTKSGSFNYGQRLFTYTPPTGQNGNMLHLNLHGPNNTAPNKHFDTMAILSGNPTIIN